jgi:ketosteroid isomerase-like protein
MGLRDEMPNIQRAYLEAYWRGDAEACTDFFTDDVVYVTGGMDMIKGRDSMLALHKEIIGAKFEVNSRELINCEEDGDLAWALEKVDTQDGVHYCHLSFRRESDGVWRVCVESEIAI